MEFGHLIQVLKSVTIDTPPLKDNFLRLDEEYEKGFSNKNEAIEFFRKLDILEVKNKRYAETYARVRILQNREKISSIQRSKHPELF